MSPEEAISVIGGGSWGTALANHIGRKGYRVRLWFRDPEKAKVVAKKRENPFYHPGIPLSENVMPTSSLEEAVFQASILIFAVPTQNVRSVLKAALSYIKKKKLILSAIKGIEKGTLLLPNAIFREVLGKDIKYASLTGPSFSREVMEGLFTSVVVSSESSETSRKFQDILHTDGFRVYINKDLTGCEVAAATKNVIAIAAGMADGLGLGLNARAALITRGLTEITRLGVAMGADPITFQGLSGIGDLLLTSTGNLSRNRTLGFLLGKGMSLEEAKKRLSGIPEGVETAQSVIALSEKLGVRMPISREVYSIIFEGKPIEKSMKDLIKGRPSHE